MSVNDVNRKLTSPLVNNRAVPPPPSPKPSVQPKAKTDSLQIASNPPATNTTGDLAAKVAQAQQSKKEDKGFFDSLFDTIGDGFNGAIDWTEKKVSDTANGAADLVKDVPVLGSVAKAVAWTQSQSAQLVGGVLKGAGSMVGGIANIVVHPVDTVKGLYSLAEHIPMLPANPLKLLSGAYDVAVNGKDPMETLNKSLNPLEVLKDDAEFGKALVNGFIEPYKKAIDEGKGAEALGRGIFDIGSLFIGAGEIKAGTKVAEVAGDISKVVKAADAAGDASKVVKAADAAGDASKVVKAADAAGDASKFAKAAEEGKILIEKAKEAITAGKTAEAGKAMTAERAAEIAKLQGKELFDAIKHLEPEKLKDLAKLEPKVVDKFGALLGSQQQKSLADINGVLSKYGVEADGPIKQWKSMLGKLEKDTAENLSKGKLPASPADLNDLNRARVNAPNLKPQELQKMVSDIQSELRAKYPEKQFNFVVKDAVGDAVMGDTKALYKGRINMQIQEVTGGVKGPAFELQLGPKHLTDFWETPFKMPGSPNSFNIHDTVYKGVNNLLKDDDLLSKVGKGLNEGKNLSREEAIALGRQAVEKTVDSYRGELQKAIVQAKNGTKSLDFASTATLREQIAEIFKTIKDDPKLPEGLHGMKP